MLEKQIPELISSYLADVPENIIQQYTGEYKNTDDDSKTDGVLPEKEVLDDKDIKNDG